MIKTIEYRYQPVTDWGELFERCRLEGWRIVSVFVANPPTPEVVLERDVWRPNLPDEHEEEIDDLGDDELTDRGRNDPSSDEEDIPF